MTFVDIHKNNAFEKKIVIKEEVDNILLEEHKSHFRQAEDTPCCKKDVEKEILKLVEKEGREFKLQHRVDTTTNKILQHLKRLKTDPIEISEDISTNNVIQGLDIWKESTSTSPSERTLPLYKTWIKAVGDEKQLSEI